MLRERKRNGTTETKHRRVYLLRQFCIFYFFWNLFLAELSGLGHHIDPYVGSLFQITYFDVHEISYCWQHHFCALSTKLNKISMKDEFVLYQKTKKYPKKGICPGLPRWQHGRNRSYMSIEHE